MKACGRWLLAGLLVVGLLGCGPKHRQRVEGRWLTFYLLPRPQVGEVRAALRVQDRDYRIETGLHGLLSVTEQTTGQRQTQILKPGPGKDLRCWINLPRPGGYDLDYHLEEAGGRTLTARFLVKLSGKNRRMNL